MNRRTFFGVSAATIGGLLFGSIPKPQPKPKFCFGILDMQGKIVGYSPIETIKKVNGGWVFKAQPFNFTGSATIRGVTIFDKQGRRVRDRDFTCVVPVADGDVLKTDYSLRGDKPGLNPDEMLEALRTSEKQ